MTTINDRIASFLRANFLGPTTARSEEEEAASGVDFECNAKLSVDALSVNPLAKGGGLLLRALEETAGDPQQRAHALFLHQLLLNGPSKTIRSELLHLLLHLPSTAENTLFAAAVFTHYGEISKASSAIELAAGLLGTSAKYTGVLGKRTKFQAADLPILAVSMSCSAESAPSEERTCIKAVPHEKESSLLDQPQLATDDPSVTGPLPVLHQCVLLAMARLLMATESPQEHSVSAKLEAIANRILVSHQSWVTTAGALYVRSVAERENAQAANRAACQLQALIDQTVDDSPEDRLRCFFAAPTPSIWGLQQEAARCWHRLGAFGAAAELFLKQEAWHEAVDCYTRLGERQAAESLVRLRLKATPQDHRLWCALAVVIPSENKSAKLEALNHSWALSGNRYAQAQRLIAEVYIEAKEWPLAVEALERALAIFPLSAADWYKAGVILGLAGDLQRSAACYQKVVAIDDENAPAWNNLGVAQLQLGKARDALACFERFLREDFANAKGWQNFLAAAIACSATNQAIFGLHRLLNVDAPAVALGSLEKLFAQLQSVPREAREKEFPLLGEMLQQAESTVLGESAMFWLLVAEFQPLAAFCTKREALERAYRISSLLPSESFGLKGKVVLELHTEGLLSARDLRRFLQRHEDLHCGHPLYQVLEKIAPDCNKSET